MGIEYALIIFDTPINKKFGSFEFYDSHRLIIWNKELSSIDLKF